MLPARPFHLLPLAVTFVLLAWLGLRDSRQPSPLAAPVPAPLATVTPTLTPTPGWWQALAFATPTLPNLPGVPKPGFQGGEGGGGAGEKVPFRVLSCPLTEVRIADIRTGERGWWQIAGSATLATLWYWKAEISPDGRSWAGLYQAQAPVRDGVLVQLNLGTIGHGPHQLRLTAVDRTGNYPEPCLVEVTVP